jgi:hypothetical protein
MAPDYSWRLPIVEQMHDRSTGELAHKTEGNA